MLALLAKAEFPKAPLDLQIQIGWLVLLSLSLLALWVWTRAESVRRAIFAREDPRLFALFRIGLGLITIQNFWNLLMHWRVLWTDEGMFTLDEIQKRYGRKPLAGWTEVDGFLDGWGVLKFFWGKMCLLYLDSSPEFVALYLALLFGALALFTIGFRTRVTGWLCLLLIFSLYNRNSVYLEGHDTVFKCVWFATVFAKTGEAWSVDNWFRCWRERRFKRLAERGGGVPLDTLKFVDHAAWWLWGGLWAWLFCAKVEFTTWHVNLVVIGGILISFLVIWTERERRRAAAGQGKLSLREPLRFQRIPAWPRYILIIQLVCIYCATGMYKTGSVWRKGDALYFALNMDHFYRFEVVTQWASLYFATNVFRVMSYVTWIWEKLFPLVALGLILQWGLRNREALWYKAQEAVRWRKWLGRLALVSAYLTLYRVLIVAYPWCIALQKNGDPRPAGQGLLTLHLWFALIIPLIVSGWFVLGRWPIKLPRPRLTGSSERVVIDQQFVRNWLLGRRVWLTIGVLFHGMLLVTMNIGMFPVIMVWIYVAYFEAAAFLRVLRWCATKLRKSKLTAWLAPKRIDPALRDDASVLETAEQTLRRDPTGPWWLDPWRLFAGPWLLLRSRKRAALVEINERGRTRGGTIPDGLVLALGLVLVSLIGLRGLEAETEAEANAGETTFVSAAPHGAEQERAQKRAERARKRSEAKARKHRIAQLGDAARWWAYSLFAFAAVSHFRRRRRFDQIDPIDPDDPDKPSGALEPVRPTEPVLIGGTILRTAVLFFMVYHCSAVAVRFIPDYPITQAWRGESRQVFGDWVRGTNQTQSWKMFAPNPPRSNTFMRTVVVDTDGQYYQVGKDHYTNRPYVFWYNDRMRKMHRRMVGKSKWYLRYWGQYHCRDWALKHDGHLPKEVRVLKLKTGIPKPEELVEAGVPSDPRKRKLRIELIETHTCEPDVITPEIKRRRGWPLSEADKQRIAKQPSRAEAEAEKKRSKWEQREDFGGKPREPNDKAQ